MGDLVSVLSKIENILWGNWLNALILIASVYFTFRFKGVQIRNIKHQLSLLINKGNDDDTGIDKKGAFFTIIGYRVGTANIAGVCTAIFFGGPGAVVWMLICSLVNASVSYAECTLGQVYKIRQDKEYRGGAYHYIDRALGMKGLAKFFAGLTVLSISLIGMGIQPNAIASAWQTSVGVPTWITGLIICGLLFATISGGIKRIAKVASTVVPFMTVAYLVLAIAVIIVNITSVPAMLGVMFSSAFGFNAIFGGLMGQAVLWGVKRSIGSSGSGISAAVPTAAAAEVSHPGEAGLVSAFSVFVDVAVCLCTGLIVLISDCFNVISNGTYLHLGQGSDIMAQQAAINSAGVPWAQAAANTVFSGLGPFIIALCLSFFAFTTMLNQYYQSETALAYLFGNFSEKARKTVINLLRIAMSTLCILYSVSHATTIWSVSSSAIALMLWINMIVLIVLSSKVAKIQKDYSNQLKAGIKAPIFNPQKLGIKNADLWMDINKDKFTEENSVPAKE